MLLESQNILASLRAEKEGSGQSDPNDDALEKRSKSPAKNKSKPKGKKATAVEMLRSLTPYQVQYITLILVATALNASISLRFSQCLRYHSERI